MHSSTLFGFILMVALAASVLVDAKDDTDAVSERYCLGLFKMCVNGRYPGVRDVKRFCYRRYKICKGAGIPDTTSDKDITDDEVQDVVDRANQLPDDGGSKDSGQGSEAKDDGQKTGTNVGDQSQSKNGGDKNKSN